MGLFGYTAVDWDVLGYPWMSQLEVYLLGCPGMSQDILVQNRMPWTWDCLDIQQLTGMSWDIPRCPLVRMSWDVPGYPGTQ